MRSSIKRGVALAAAVASACVTGLIAPTAASALESGTRSGAATAAGRVCVLPPRDARATGGWEFPQPRLHARAATLGCFRFDTTVFFTDPEGHRDALAYALLLIDAFNVLYPPDKNDVVVTVSGDAAKVDIAILAPSEPEARYEAFDLIYRTLDEFVGRERGVGID